MWLLIRRIVKNVYIHIAASIMASMFTWSILDCSQTKKCNTGLGMVLLTSQVIDCSLHSILTFILTS